MSTAPAHRGKPVRLVWCALLAAAVLAGALEGGPARLAVALLAAYVAASFLLRHPAGLQGRSTSRRPVTQASSPLHATALPARR